MSLWQKLSEPGYRAAFVGSSINIRLPFQIRAMLTARRWTRQDLATKSGMAQRTISNLVRGESRLTLKALHRLAKAFDCALVVSFVPFSELVRKSEEFEPDYSAASFEDDVEPTEMHGNGRTVSVHSSREASS